MPVYKFEGPDGKIHKAEADTPEEAQAGLEEVWASSAPEPDTPEITVTAPRKPVQAPAPQKTSWLDVPGRALVNAPESALNFAQSLVQPILHPIETAKGLANIGMGVTQHALNLLPERVTKDLPKMDTAAADAVGKYFVDRYGSEDGLKEAMSTDPIGVASDFALLLTGGGAALKAVSTTGKAGELVSAAGRAVDPLTYGGKAVQSTAKAVAKAAPNAPGVSAGKRYVQRLAQSAGITPEALEAAHPSLTAAEAIGPTGGTAAGALARREGATGEAFRGLTETRRLERPETMLGDFAEAAGISPYAAAGNIEELVRQGREAASPLYEAAYAVKNVDSPLLTGLSKRPSMQSAMQRAVKIAAEEDRNPIDLGFETRLVPSRVGGIPDVEQIVLTSPSMQTWDYVKRGLDAVINSYANPLTGKLKLDESTRPIVATATALRKELTSINPEYKKALGVSGDYLSSQDAFNRGGKLLFDGKISERQFGQTISKMEPAEFEALKGGTANHLYDLAQNGKLDPKVFKTPRVRQKLMMILGEDAANTMIDNITRHGAMQNFERINAPGAGSGTAGWNEAMRQQDVVMDPMRQVTQDLATRGARGVVSGFLGRSAQGIQDWMSTPSAAQRDIAGQALLGSPQDLAQMLREIEAGREATRSTNQALTERYLPQGVLSPQAKAAALLREREIGQ